MSTGFNVSKFPYRPKGRLAESIESSPLFKGRQLLRHPGPVVASNKATDRIVELYEGLGFRLERLEGPRRISCDGDRAPVAEVLAVRNFQESVGMPVVETGVS